MFDIAMRIECIHILKCARADLQDLLSERDHPGHETLEEIQLLLEKLEGPVEIW